VRFWRVKNVVFSTRPGRGPDTPTESTASNTSTAKIDPPPETVVLKKLFAGKLLIFGSLKFHIINLKFVQKYLKIRLR
jgi:hypothetical protein